MLRPTEIVEFKDFSRFLIDFPVLFKADLIFKTFQESPLNSCTFQVCGNPDTGFLKIQTGSFELGSFQQKLILLLDTRNNKGADQYVPLCSLISTIVNRFLASTIIHAITCYTQNFDILGSFCS